MARGVPSTPMDWPLQVASHDVIPVELEEGWTGTVHLAERARPGELAGSAGLAEFRNPSRPPFAGGAGADPLKEPAWGPVTLCGRDRGPMVADLELDIFGFHRGLVCRACWRRVERWLVPPAPADGEDEVVAWAVETVLEFGEALVEEVPVPRLESFRRRVRSQLKAAIGGAVRTQKLGDDAVWVWSALVHDAKTPERWQQELRAAADRMDSLVTGQPVPPARWRGRWSDIAG